MIEDSSRINVCYQQWWFRTGDYDVGKYWYLFTAKIRKNTKTFTLIIIKHILSRVNHLRALHMDLIFLAQSTKNIRQKL